MHEIKIQENTKENNLETKSQDRGEEKDVAHFISVLIVGICCLCGRTIYDLVRACCSKKPNEPNP